LNEIYKQKLFMKSVGKCRQGHQGVCQHSLKVDDGGTGAAAFEGAKT
jgi:hypothetical protein